MNSLPETVSFTVSIHWDCTCLPIDETISASIEREASVVGIKIGGGVGGNSYHSQPMATVKQAIRKAVAKGYSELEQKVRQATCNDPWGPATSELQQLCNLAEYSYYILTRRDGDIILEILDKRLNDSGKNWRHVYKSLVVYQYLIENGPEYILNHCKANLHLIKTLKEYQYIDDKMVDQGQKIRAKSRELTELILDEEKLKSIRNNRSLTRERIYGGDSPTRSGRSGGDDDDLRRAIELSKQDALADEQKRQQRREQEDLQRAIELSKRESQPAQTPASKPKEDIIDFFSSIETPQPTNMFGGFDPFQQQQMQQMQYQQQQQMQYQQQMLLQQQQQEQMQQQMLLQEQMRQQEQERLRQQQLQQQQFALQFSANPHNPFAAPPKAPEVSKPDEFANLDTNPNAILDPFASLASKSAMPFGVANQNTGKPAPFGNQSAMGVQQTGTTFSTQSAPFTTQASPFGQSSSNAPFNSMQTNSSPFNPVQVQNTGLSNMNSQFGSYDQTKKYQIVNNSANSSGSGNPFNRNPFQGGNQSLVPQPTGMSTATSGGMNGMQGMGMMNTGMGGMPTGMNNPMMGQGLQAQATGMGQQRPQNPFGQPNQFF